MRTDPLKKKTKQNICMWRREQMYGHQGGQGGGGGWIGRLGLIYIYITMYKIDN